MVFVYSFPVALMISNIYYTPISYANLRIGKILSKGLMLTVFELIMYLLVFILFYVFSKTTMEKQN